MYGRNDMNLKWFFIFAAVAVVSVSIAIGFGIAWWVL